MGQGVSMVCLLPLWEAGTLKHSSAAQTCSQLPGEASSASVSPHRGKLARAFTLWGCPFSRVFTAAEPASSGKKEGGYPQEPAQHPPGCSSWQPLMP